MRKRGNKFLNSCGGQVIRAHFWTAGSVRGRSNTQGWLKDTYVHGPKGQRGKRSPT